jgi:4-oxalocrotonate tautomerase
MPYINIRTGGQPLTDQQIKQLVTETTEHMTSIMGKKGELTSVRIEPADTGYWGIGGVLVSDSKTSAAHMDIKVTAGTNSDAEKAAMVEAGHALLIDVLGVLPEATYVVIHELPGANWGYAGKTQAARAKAAIAA